MTASEIRQRLRTGQPVPPDDIERLIADNDRYRVALEELAQYADYDGDRISARAALEGTTA